MNTACPPDLLFSQVPNANGCDGTQVLRAFIFTEIDGRHHNEPSMTRIWRFANLKLKAF